MKHERVCPECGHKSDTWGIEWVAEMQATVTYGAEGAKINQEDIAEQSAGNYKVQCLECGDELDWNLWGEE